MRLILGNNMTLGSRHIFRAVKFYSAIENVDGFSSRETQFYSQGIDIAIIDRASQAALPTPLSRQIRSFEQAAS
jgi:hypothetical protein